MTITINTTTKNGFLILYIKNKSGAILLQVQDNDHGSCVLVPGSTYFFEWHVWSATGASYQIDADVSPASTGFPPFKWDKTYPAGHDDMGGFYFTV